MPDRLSAAASPSPKATKTGGAPLLARARPVGVMEVNAIGHEQDGAR
jgi:hypothetical protein